MNKNWEDDFDEKYWNEEFGAYKIKTFIAKHLSRAVAKERTQLLVRVREEVIGEDVILPPTYALPTKEKRSLALGGVTGWNDAKRESRKQLKKLEIISEEGK